MHKNPASGSVSSFMAWRGLARKTPTMSLGLRKERKKVLGYLKGFL